MSGRADLPLLRVYASEQAHSSVEKGVITLGLGQRSLRKIPTDAEFRMDAGRARARRSRRTGPRATSPSASSPPSARPRRRASIPCRPSPTLCERERLWLHVDAAYAGSAAVVPELRHILDGSERADSLVAQPAQVALRRPSTSPSSTRGGWTCCTAPSRSCPSTCARSTRGTRPSATDSEYGIQLGRRFRALKLWMVLRYFGRDGLAARIREHCRLARLFASWVEESRRLGTARARPLRASSASAPARRATARQPTSAPRASTRLNEQIMHAVNCDRRGVPLAHEAQRPLHPPPRRRQHPHHRSTRPPRLGNLERTPIPSNLTLNML